MSEWIPVDEDLPEIGQEVIGLIVRDLRPELKTESKIKRVDESDCDWRTDDGYELSYWMTVTHWKPPQEKDSNPELVEGNSNEHNT